MKLTEEKVQDIILEEARAVVQEGLGSLTTDAARWAGRKMQLQSLISRWKRSEAASFKQAADRMQRAIGDEDYAAAFDLIEQVRQTTRVSGTDQKILLDTVEILFTDAFKDIKTFLRTTESKAGQYEEFASQMKRVINESDKLAAEFGGNAAALKDYMLNIVNVLKKGTVYEGDSFVALQRKLENGDLGEKHLAKMISSQKQVTSSATKIVSREKLSPTAAKWVKYLGITTLATGVGGLGLGAVVMWRPNKGGNGGELSVNPKPSEQEVPRKQHPRPGQG